MSHERFLNDILKKFSSTEMLPIYVHDHNNMHDLFIFSTLIPLHTHENILNKFEWDMHSNEGHPDSYVYGSDDEAVYLRYGNDDGLEPIVICRNFDDIKPEYIEIIEEFRLFHNLYHDRKTGNYIKISDEGIETIVAEEKDGNIKIRTKELRQFLAIKGMCLSIQFDCREYSTAYLNDIEQRESEGDDKREDYYTYSLRYGDANFCSNDSKSFSIIMGKRLIFPLQKSKSGIWGFDKSDEKKKYVEFIIGENDEGEQIFHSANPELLAFFGSNPKAPNYLTPIHFSNEVLDKYRNNPAKYSVDRLLRCGSLWSMQMDTGGTDKVVVWLGDLGRDLPYEEQLHWRSFNISPSGKLISDSYYKTQLMAAFSDSEHPVPIFKTNYEKLKAHALDHLGWEILLSLSEDDQHFFSALKLLTCDEQKEFDEQILALTKILIDSLNEKQLTILLKDCEIKKVTGSIRLLENIFRLKQIDCSNHIQFLRNLQGLRSTGSAHRKGKNYQELCRKIGLDTKTKSQVFLEILQQGTLYLKFLDENIEFLK